MKSPKHLNLLFPLVIIIFFQSTAFSQRSDVLLTNSQTFEIEAYKDIEGSPYLFAEWHKGKVYGKESTKDAEEEYLLNYNGYNKSFEVRKDKRFIALDEQHYSKVVIDLEEDGEKKKLTFKTNMHPTFPNRFMKVVFEGIDFSVVQDFQVRLSSREKQTYANKQTIESFRKTPSYYLVKGNQIASIKLKKKHLLGLFKDQESAIKKFVKKQQLKLNSEEDLVQLVRYYEQLKHPKTAVAANE